MICEAGRFYPKLMFLRQITIQVGIKCLESFCPRLNPDKIGIFYLITQCLPGNLWLGAEARQKSKTCNLETFTFYVVTVVAYKYTQSLSSFIGCYTEMLSIKG